MIHDQLGACNISGETSNIGALQAPDIIREELTRAAQGMRKMSWHVSMAVGRLRDWALGRAERQASRDSLDSVDSPEGAGASAATAT